MSASEGDKERRKGRGALRLALSLLVAGALLALVLSLADLGDLLSRARRVDLGLLALSLVAYLVTYLARAARFSAAGAKAPLITLVFVVSVHGALNRLMPLRTGELAYPLLAKRVGAADLGEGLIQLLMLRLLDLVTIVALFTGALGASAALGLSGLEGGDPASVALFTVALGGLCALILARLGWLLKLALRLGRALISLVGVKGGKLASALERGDEAVEAVTDLKPRRLAALGLWSFLCWGAYFVLFYLILIALQVPVTPLQTVLGSSAAIVGSVVPVSGLGTFGALEGGWTAGFVAVGLDATTAASTAILMSGLTLLFAASLGAVGWIALGLITSRRPDRADGSRSESAPAQRPPEP